MRIIGALLDHSSPKTTARYTRLADHPLKSAADRISDAITQHFGAMSADPAAQAAEGELATAAEPRPEFDGMLGAVVRTRWLDTAQAATRIGLTVGTRQTYRWMGTGPQFRKMGRRVVYAMEALDAWKVAHVEQVPPALAA